MNGDEKQDDDTVTLSFDRLKAVTALGRGAKGVVFLVKGEDFGELLALKVILRDCIEKKSNKNESDSEYKRVCFEQQVLRKFKHPLLPRLRGVLATEKIVGYAIDYCPGRDLNSLRKKQTEKMFSVDIIRFYAAELVLALQYLHSLGIAYRDLKPENIMIQENGHVMLVDFDLSTNLPVKSATSSPPHYSVTVKPDSVTRRRFSPFCCNSGISPEDSAVDSMMTPNEPDTAKKTNSFVGTEEYVAPEVILGKGHDFAVDWWSLGVLLYEMLYGTTPFKGSCRKETFNRILSREPELVGEATPLRDLIRKLLEKDPKQRIHVEKIKSHDFFKGLDWDSVLQISRPPYIPTRVEDENWGTDGNNKIDVELFVEGVFGGVGDDKVDVVNNGEGNDNEKVLVKGLNHNLCEIDNFLVF